MKYMESEVFEILNKQYLLMDEISQIRGKKGIPLLIKNKKNIQQFFRSISFSPSKLKISELDLDDLFSKRILAKLSENEEIIGFTLKGLLLFEYRINDYNKEFDDLLNDLNHQYFDTIMELREKPLESWEKAILITTLGLGAITEEFPLSVSDDNKNYFKDSVEIAKNYLLNFDSNLSKDGTLEKLWSENIVGEDSILQLLRRVNKLPTKTENIFIKTSGRLYLRLIDQEKLDTQKTKFILKKIFDKKILEFNQKKDFTQILDEIQKKSPFLFSSLPPYNKQQIRRDLFKIIDESL